MKPLPISLGGIYQIILPDGTRYIGRTTNFKSRYRAHVGDARHKRHGVAGIQHAYDAQGEAGICMEVLLICAKRYQRLFEAVAIRLHSPEHNKLKLHTVKERKRRLK